MPIFYDSSTPPRPRWHAWPTLLSGALLFHYAVSATTWLLWIGSSLGAKWWELTFALLVQSIPAFLLCGLSAFALRLAIGGRRIARYAAVALVIASVTLFAIDIHFQRSQVHTFIARAEYWERGGKAHDYFTWWWYNDTQFRRFESSVVHAIGGPAWKQ